MLQAAFLRENPDGQGNTDDARVGIAHLDALFRLLEESEVRGPTRGKSRIARTVTVLIQRIYRAFEVSILSIVATALREGGQSHRGPISLLVDTALQDSAHLLWPLVLPRV